MGILFPGRERENKILISPVEKEAPFIDFRLDRSTANSPLYCVFSDTSI